MILKGEWPYDELCGIHGIHFLGLSASVGHVTNSRDRRVSTATCTVQRSSGSYRKTIGGKVHDLTEQTELTQFGQAVYPRPLRLHFTEFTDSVDSATTRNGRDTFHSFDTHWIQWDGNSGSARVTWVPCINASLIHDGANYHTYHILNTFLTLCQLCSATFGHVGTP